MKFQSIIATVAALASPMAVIAKSQDYARHIELSLLFYEAQRSGKLPENNRIYWRHDSMVDAGADNGVDLSGGYYDAGDNVKFNFPGAATMTLLAWSGVDYAEGYKKAGQWEYILDAVRWGADYFIKCHTGKNELYVQVGSGQTDHGYWYPPEYINYKYPSYKITASAPGSEVAGDTASFLAATSILFKDTDPSYSQKCLKHAKEIYDFADTYRGEYTKAVSDAQQFYANWSGYDDELAFGALWLYRATGDESYLNKFKKIADASYGEQDTKAYGICTGPISWDDKRPGGYILGAIVTGEDKYLNKAISYCDAVLTQPKTRGGLWYNDNLSKWGSNRYASNAASMLGMLANYLPKDHPKRSKYVDFVKSQTDYILGDNPAHVNYVVGAEKNSPKAVHHRGASGTYDSQDTNAKPTDHNVYTIWGALAGGPGKDDSYTDTRKNYEMNEVALDYNAGFQMNLAFLTKEGLSKPDPDSVKVHERSYPKKAETPDIKVSFKDGEFSISTGSGMRCSGWCLSFTSSSYKIDQSSDCTTLKLESPNYTLCNKRENNSLDGEGTVRTVKFQGSGSGLPTEFTVLCDGFHAPLNHQKVTYKPEWGREYKIVQGGGVGKTLPLFEETECWPGFICDPNSRPNPSTTVKPEPTQPVSNDDCFALDLGYKCCNDAPIAYTDESGNWGYVNNDWCGIGGSSHKQQPTPEPTPEPVTCGDYPCCSECNAVYTDDSGDWGVENGEWCLIKASLCGGEPEPEPVKPETCTAQDQGYSCCSSCDVVYTDESGPWGVENGTWCGISSRC